MNHEIKHTENVVIKKINVTKLKKTNSKQIAENQLVKQRYQRRVYKRTSNEKKHFRNKILGKIKNCNIIVEEIKNAQQSFPGRTLRMKI